MGWSAAAHLSTGRDQWSRRRENGPCHRRRMGSMAWWAPQRSAPQREKKVKLVHIGNPGLMAMVLRVMVASVALLASGLALSACVSASFVSSLESGKQGALRFQSLTVDEEDFLRGRASGTPVTITGELRLPTTGAERVPAVVLVHGCSGLTAATDGWVRELPRFGIATFLVDSFTGRNIRQVCTGRDRITTGSRVIDAYRALGLLATHPRIDAERIAMMGFSQGGRVALWTALTRFQEAWGPPTVPSRSRASTTR